ncbi:MAG: hypothetical protein ABR985_16655 [Methanotrichaceae archaeon]|jgi:hypothetical protein
MEGIGVFKLSEMLRQQDEMGKFEATLITCIHWFSISQTKIELEDKLLNLITCLEIIFTPESKDPITQNIAEGTAILTENDVAKRKERVEKIRSLYGRRSSLSHHGKGKIYDFELRELRSIIGTALAILISRSGDFHNKDELHKWLEYIRLGGSTDLDKWTEYKLGNSPS